MRDVMRDVVRKAAEARALDHFGLAYDGFSPKLKSDRKPDPCERNDWLRRCAEIRVAQDYGQAFERWRSSFPASAAETKVVAASSRLLIGHGNPSGADVGLTVHRTWGVPMIPGSALKGLTAHYVDAAYGGGAEEPERRTWLGPTWSGRRIRKGGGPGNAFGTLFGAPEVDDEPRSARGGVVEFHDALYVPGSVSGDKPFARDVLTVHQKPYYDKRGETWPNDWTSPIPVGFVTVRPGTRFLLALTGPRNWAFLAMQLLLEALAEWGVGGKTSSGYGRLARLDERRQR